VLYFNEFPPNDSGPQIFDPPPPFQTEEKLVFLNEFGGSGGAPTEGEQGGESPAFRAGKGQVFPHCEPRKGHRGALEVKKHQVLLEQRHSLLKPYNAISGFPGFRGFS
jgi:hypothetical protein